MKASSNVVLTAGHGPVSLEPMPRRRTSALTKRNIHLIQRGTVILKKIVLELVTIPQRDATAGAVNTPADAAILFVADVFKIE